MADSSNPSSPPKSQEPRFDPIFYPWKDQLRNIGFIGSFVASNMALQPVYYPCKEAGGAPIPPSEFRAYVETHTWERPQCFCPLRTPGFPAPTVLKIPVTTGEHLGDPCLTCSTMKCSYFLNLAHFVRTHPDLPCKTFPLKDAHTGTSLSLTPFKPTFLFPPASGSSNTIPSSVSPEPLKMKSGRRDSMRKIYTVSPPRDFTSVQHALNAAAAAATSSTPIKLEDTPYPMKALFDTASPSSSQDRHGTAGLGDVFTQRPRDSEFEYNMFTQVKDTGFIDDLSRFWVDVPHLSGRRACDVPVSDSIETMERLFRLDGETQRAGITFEELMLLLSQCPHCRLIMTPEKLQVHVCKFESIMPSYSSPSSTSLTAPGPSSLPSTLRPAKNVPRNLKRRASSSLPRSYKAMKATVEHKGKGKGKAVETETCFVEHEDGTLEILSTDDSDGEK